MEIIELNEQRFNDFSVTYPQSNFYQSVNYANFMSKRGYEILYLGLTDNMDGIKAAALLLIKTDEASKKKIAYSPRGFLINWNDDYLISEFTNKIKEFLDKKKITSLKIDPNIVYKEHNFDGSEKFTGESNTSIIKKLQSLGYIHLGYNNGMETYKLRWNCLCKLNNNIINLYNTLPKSGRDKIKAASEYGIKIYKGTNSDINLFYTILDNANAKLDYFLDIYQFFNKSNEFEIYFAKLEPSSFVNSSKLKYENEEKRNNELNMLLQDFNNPNKDAIINEKLKSDELLNKYKKDMQDAIKSFQKNPNGIFLASTIVIKYAGTVNFFSNAHNKYYENYYAEYLLKWKLIEKYAKEGYKIVNHLGIMGDFSGEYNNLLRRELSNEIVEYVGEFDLVINKKNYYSGSKIINWLNKPI